MKLDFVNIHKMKKTLTFFFCALSSLIGAQNAYNQFGWGTTSTLGYSNYSKLANGDLLLIADASTGVDGNKTTDNFGMADLWVTRITSNNQVLWQKSYGGTLYDDRGNIKELNNGDLLITCRSNSPISGNKTVDTKGDYDFWVMRTNATGDILWQKTFGTSGTDVPVDIVAISDTLFCLVGVSDFQGIEGDKTENSSGNLDYWIVLIDENGNKIWDKTIGGTSGDGAAKGIWDAQNQRIYIVGSSTSGIGGLKTEVHYGIQDMWLVSLDLNGNLMGQKTIGGSNSDEVSAISLDNQGNIFLASSSNSDISGTKTQNSFGLYDSWLVKLNSNLEILGDYSFGGTDYDNLYSILVRDNGQLILTCGSASEVNGNKTEPLKGAYDCWFIGLNEVTLEIEWETVIGGSLIDSPLIFWETPDSYKVVSISGSPISIDKTVSSWGETDFWVYEFSKTVALEELSNDMLIYPNPSQDFITLKSEDSNFSAFTITDINGRISKQGELTNTSKISVSELQKGIYLITLKNKQGIETKQKFVKE